MTVTRASKSDSKLKRRFRFSLRTLLVVMALVCIALGWKMNQVHRQRRAVETIQAQGGHVRYDYQYDADMRRPISGAQPPGPAWFRKLAGDDFFAHVAFVAVRNNRRSKEFVDASPLADLPHLKVISFLSIGVTDLTPLAESRDLKELNLLGTRGVTNLSPLAKLTRLEVLLVVSVPVDDITPLANLINLEHIELHGTRLHDVTPLANLNKLEMLSLGGTQVRDISALSGLTALRDLNLSQTQVTDLSPLANLVSLAELDIRDTPVSDEEVERLQRALPDLKITR